MEQRVIIICGMTIVLQVYPHLTSNRSGWSPRYAPQAKAKAAMTRSRVHTAAYNAVIVQRFSRGVVVPATDDKTENGFSRRTAMTASGPANGK